MTEEIKTTHSPTEEEIKAMNVHQRVAGILAELQNITFTKDGKSWAYNYIKKPQLLEKINPLRLKYRVNIYYEQLSQETEFYSYVHKSWDKNEKKMIDKDVREYFTKLDMKFHIVNIDNPSDKIELKYQSQGTDDAEKGPGKAGSYALRYFLLDFFGIAAEDDSTDPDSKKNQKGRGRDQGYVPGGSGEPVTIDREIMDLMGVAKFFMPKVKKYVKDTFEKEINKVEELAEPEKVKLRDMLKAEAAKVSAG